MAARTQEGETEEGEIETGVDDRIKELVDDRAATIENRIDELEDELNELENFATVTLRDRRIGENTTNIDKISESFSGFAESTTDKLNALESRQEINTLLLAAIAEALGDAEDVDVDLSTVREYQEDRLVTDTSADEQLEEALNQLS
jgi:hypothetical protein